jgi:hypothetical protein
MGTHAPCLWMSQAQGLSPLLLLWVFLSLLQHCQCMDCAHINAPAFLSCSGTDTTTAL